MEEREKIMSEIQQKIDGLREEIARDFAKKEALNAYATSQDLEAYAKSEVLDDYARASALDVYAKASSLEDYAKAVELRDLSKTVGDDGKGLVNEVNSLKGKVGDGNSGLVKDTNDIKSSFKATSDGIKIERPLEINDKLKIKGRNLLVDEHEIIKHYSSVAFNKDVDFSYGNSWEDTKKMHEIAYQWAHEQYTGRQIMLVVDFRSCKTSKHFSVQNSQGLIFKITKQEEGGEEKDWNGPYDLPFADCGITQMFTYFDEPAKRTTYRLCVRLRASLVGNTKVNGFFKMIAI